MPRMETNCHARETRHAVFSARVFPNLLKRQTHFFSETLLRIAGEIARDMQIAPCDHIDRVRTFA